MNVHTTKTLSCGPTELTAGVMREFLGDVTDSAKIDITVTPGDRPFDSDMLTVRVTEGA